MGKGQRRLTAISCLVALSGGLSGRLSATQPTPECPPGVYIECGIVAIDCIADPFAYCAEIVSARHNCGVGVVLDAYCFAATDICDSGNGDPKVACGIAQSY